MGMRNLFGWDNGRSGFSVSLVDSDGAGGEAERPFVELKFVVPSQPALEAPRDVTPSKVVVQPRRDYPTAPDPGPVVDVAPNPPNSGVPLVRPRKPGSWME
jgi:hypothetical protein